MRKVILTVLAIIVLLIVGFASYIYFALPNVGKAPDLKISYTPEMVKHGEYLARHVSLCMDCHGVRDWSRFAGPPVAGTLGRGGENFNEQMGFPGNFYSKNITPAGLKDWTDGEIFRAIATGVNKKGEAMFPVMPYAYYGKMDREDIYDIIAYLRSLKPIEYTPPAGRLSFPMNFIINTIPQKASLVTKPSPSDTLAYGAYMINAAGCMECHTPEKNHNIIPGKAFIGGREYNTPNGILRSANLTPDNETGIGKWTSLQFVQRFKVCEHLDSSAPIPKDQVNTIMPWQMYAGMDTSDLKAIYSYLRSLKPVKNKLVHFEEKLNKKTAFKKAAPVVLRSLST